MPQTSGVTIGPSCDFFEQKENDQSFLLKYIFKEFFYHDNRHILFIFIKIMKISKIIQKWIAPCLVGGENRGLYSHFTLGPF